MVTKAIKAIMLITTKDGDLILAWEKPVHIADHHLNNNPIYLTIL